MTACALGLVLNCSYLDFCLVTFEKVVGKLLTIKGHVVKARPKRLRVATADFCCLKCGASQTHAFDRGQYSIPTRCNDNCRSRSFTMIRPTARYIDAQEIRLQEAQEENTVQAGRTPRQIEVELTHDLVDICRPGDIVFVAATVAAINTAVASGQMGKRAKETSTYKLCTCIWWRSDFTTPFRLFLFYRKRCSAN